MTQLAALTKYHTTCIMTSQQAVTWDQQNPEFQF